MALVSLSDSPHVKQCTNCSSIKPLSDFYIDKRDNRPVARCKLCWKQKTKEYVSKNPDKARRWSRASAARNREARRNYQIERSTF